MPANVESDPFFTLLTDALRAGPGSPQWNEAVASLREQGVEVSDERRMLLEVRENLEAGRDYRSVRAGTGFTRKVMAEIEHGPASGKKNGFPAATVVAVVCGLLILSGVGYLAWRMTSHDTNTEVAVAELETKSQGFVDVVTDASFGGEIPSGWHRIGSLNLPIWKGIAPATRASAPETTLGGGVVIDHPLSAGKPFAADVSVYGTAPTPEVLLEVFVSTDGNFSADKATSSRDLVWQLRGIEQNVLVNGSGKIGDAPPAYHPYDNVRVIVGPEVAIVETIPVAGGKPHRLWAGPHALGAGARYVGIRFIQIGKLSETLSVQSVKITTAPGT